MRTKDEILDSAHWNFIMSAKPRDVSLVHSLHMLEVIIDIRDILNDRLNFIYRLFNEHFNRH